MITLFGIEFTRDEVQVVVAESGPFWFLNQRGALRLAQNPPYPGLGDLILAYLHTLPEGDRD